MLIMCRWENEYLISDNGQITIKIEFTKGRGWVQRGAMYMGQVGEINRKPDNHFEKKKAFIKKAKLHSSHSNPYHCCHYRCSDGCHWSLFLPTFSSLAWPKLPQVLCIRFGCPLFPRAPFWPHFTHLAVGGHVWHCVCVCASERGYRNFTVVDRMAPRERVLEKFNFSP